MEETTVSSQSLTLCLLLLFMLLHAQLGRPYLFVLVIIAKFNGQEIQFSGGLFAPLS